MVILLASYPRSGNTWFRALAHVMFGIRGADCHHPSGELSKEAGLRELGLLIGQSSLAHVEESSLGFLKTHEMADDDDQRPAICLVRDGRDAYVSYAHFALTFSPNPSGVDFQTQLRTMVQSTDFFGGWSRNVESWLARKSPTVIVRYEDMLADPNQCLRESMERLGVRVPATGKRPPEFGELKKMEPNFFRKGKAGSWREEMTPEIEDLFWTHHGATMTRLGYAR